jgi:hypothetical protein
MPCAIADVPELSQKLLRQMLTEMFPTSLRPMFGGRYYVADSPLAKRAGGSELRIARDGTWTDAKSGESGDNVITLFAYAKSVTPAAALVIMAQKLNPSDLTRDRLVYPSDTRELIADGLSTIPDSLTKRAMSPREKADALLRHAMANAHDRQN